MDTVNKGQELNQVVLALAASLDIAVLADLQESGAVSDLH